MARCAMHWYTVAHPDHAEQKAAIKLSHLTGTAQAPWIMGDLQLWCTIDELELHMQGLFVVVDAL